MRTGTVTWGSNSSGRGPPLKHKEEEKWRKRTSVREREEERWRERKKGGERERVTEGYRQRGKGAWEKREEERADYKGS